MKVSAISFLVLCVSLSAAAVEVGAQTPVGALAIDERRGDQWGWAVDYETADAARARALGECGAGCSVVLTFGRCGAYAADQDTDSTAVGWAEAYDSAASARQEALSQCSARGGGAGCVIRVWGCNGPVVEEALGLDRASRRQIQLGLRAEGFDPGGADGMFGPRTRAAVRGWQTSRGGRATGYLDGPAAEALRSAGASGPAVAAVATPAAASAQPAAVPSPRPRRSREPVLAVDHEQHEPGGVRGVSRAVPERGVQRAGAGAAVGAAVAGGGCGRSGGDTRWRGGAPAPGGRVSAANRPGAAAAAPGIAAGDARRQPGEVFRDCAECPEMVVLPGGRLALGRYEVTVGEYRAFASATGGGAGGRVHRP